MLHARIVTVMDENLFTWKVLTRVRRNCGFYKAWKIILKNRYGDMVSLYGWFSAVISLEALNC